MSGTIEDGDEQPSNGYHLEVSRLIHAARGSVYDAWTEPEQIVKWWGAGGVICTEASMDVVPGGSYRIANRTPDGMTMWITGSFIHVEPPARLVYTWAVEPVDDPDEFSRVEVRFDEEDDGTLVTITQTLISTSEAREMNVFGWVGCLEGLDALLAP